MAIERISQTEYASMISDAVTLRDPTMDVNIGPIRDLRIDPFSEVLEFQNNRIVYINDLTSLLNAKNLVPDDLDKIVFNDNVVRWDGSSSVVVVTFARSQAPTVDITIPINFPLATVADPKTGNVVLFRTIETNTMFFATASSYYNADTDNYEIGIACASVLTGSTTQVGAYTIKTMRRTLPGIESVYNKLSTTSGRAVETNQEVADRFQLHVKGTDMGTPPGVKIAVQDNFAAAEDVYVVFGNNSYLTREQDDAGAVDVWVLGETPLTRVYDVPYPGIETLIVLDKQPLMSVTSVVSGGTTFIEGTDYEVVTDTDTYAKSNRGQDGIRFIAGAASLPATIGTDVTITYSYNALIDILVSFFTQNYYNSMGMDKLFRSAYAKEIELEADLKIDTGNPTTIKNLVVTALFNYINDLKLGNDIEEFDLDREVAKIRGVDNFTWVKLAVKDGSGVSDITVAPYEYADIAVSDIIVNLV